MKKAINQTNNNQFLQPIGAPVTRGFNVGTVSMSTPTSTQYARNWERPKFGGGSFDLGVPRDSIKPYHIKNFSFNSGTGGTLTLGGTSNGNGLMQVKDTSGAIAVRIDNTGMNIFNGDIVIQNTSSVDIIDSLGVVSTNVFATDGASSNSTNTTTGTSPVDVPGATLTSFVLDRDTRVLTMMGGFGYNVHYFDGNSSMAIQLVDSVEGTLTNAEMVGQWITTGIDGATNDVFLSVADQVVTPFSLTTFSAGTHTMKMQYYVVGSGTATLHNYEFLYLLLGQ